MQSADPLKSEAFRFLFQCTTNLINASNAPQPPHMLFYGKGIPMKIIRQSCSASLLLHPIPVPFDNESTVSDPLSIAVIARSILESYLIWERIFILHKSEAEADFWYFAWALKSFYLRTSLPPPVPDAMVDSTDPITGERKKIKAIDAFKNLNDRVEELQQALSKNSYYKYLMQTSNRHKKKKINEYITRGWKVSPSELLSESMRFLHSKDIYAYLCATAHLDHIDVKQILLAKTHPEIISFAETSLTVILVVLARICNQYPIVFPTTKPILDADINAQVWINAYKQVESQPPISSRLRN